LHPRFQVNIQAELFPGVLLYHAIQVGDTTISENDQIAVAMDVADFGKPRLARPFVRRHRFIVKGCRDIIDSRVLRDVWISKQIFNRRTDPSLLRNAKWL